MVSPCLFTRQHALKMGYFYWLPVKSSNHLHTGLNLSYFKARSFLQLQFFIYLPQNTNNNKIKQNSNTKANKSGEEAQQKPWGL